MVQSNAIATLDEAKKKALLALLKEKNVYQTPTLTVLTSLASLDDPKFTADDRVKYMPGDNPDHVENSIRDGKVCATFPQVERIQLPHREGDARGWRTDSRRH